MIACLTSYDAIMGIVSEVVNVDLRLTYFVLNEATISNCADE